MIYICNNCVGARIYLLLKLLFNNPFIWCRVSAEDMLYLILNFNTINFNNFKLESYHDNMQNSLIYGIDVDNKITIWYPHYKYDQNCSIPTKKEGVGSLDIYYNDIENYIINKYCIRKDRMLKSLNDKEEIEYIIVEDNKLDNMNYNSDMLLKFSKLDIYIIKNSNNLSTMYIAEKFLDSYNQYKIIK